MVEPQDTRIPEEILRAEQKRLRPARPHAPVTLGLPGLPADVIDLIIKFGPWLLLLAAALNGFSAIGALIGLLSVGPSPANGQLLLGALITFAAAITMGLSYVWLVQKRRLGWSLLALGLIIQFLGQSVSSGSASILFSGVELLITAYVMLQIRDYYSQN